MGWDRYNVIFNQKSRTRHTSTLRMQGDTPRATKAVSQGESPNSRSDY